MAHIIEDNLKQLIGIDGELSKPPKASMGEYAFACFEAAKKEGKNPVEYANELVERIQQQHNPLISQVQAFGPYVNFFLNPSAVATLVLSHLQTEGAAYGKQTTGEGKTYLVEFACPNPLKAFHLGHLKNLITGEAVARLFEMGGYHVVRVNYQGDVGMHVAKALWGIYDWIDQFTEVVNKPLTTRVEFLGKAYAHGAAHYEESDDAKQEVIAYNDKVYERDPSIQGVYQQARSWSLDYFADIYAAMDTRFDRLYFESETAEQGIALVKQFQQQGIFEEGDGGAIIFPGETYGLHNRVFINGKGFPTYEAKDLALAEQHFADYNPDKIIHVVGKEQTEYFRVIIAAIEQVFPDKKGVEYHLPGGFLQLKGNQKMSSRKGNIITGDALIDSVQEEIQEIMQKNTETFSIEEKDEIVRKVTVAALKYAMLKADVTRDVAFDINESVSTTGDSGPYLLYMVARINGILEKADHTAARTLGEIPATVHTEEMALILLLAEYPSVIEKALEAYDPSHIAKYLFLLAQAFSGFYAACPVLQANDVEKQFRIQLLMAVEQVMSNGLWVLGIDKVKKM